jgi:pimeloyl-ACP methyl ester carboxylesterase
MYVVRVLLLSACLVPGGAVFGSAQPPETTQPAAGPERSPAPPDKPASGPGEKAAIPGGGTASGLKPISSFDGNAIAYAIDGSGSPAIVLIHGWSCDRGHWREQVPGLASRYATISIDLPGHGQSGSRRNEWTLQAYGRDVQSVVEGLGLSKVILVGHSMGGPVALEAARLLKDRVVGIVGVDTFHNAENRIDLEQWKTLIQSYETDFPGTCDRFIRSMFPENASQELVQKVASGACSADKKIALALFKTFPDYDMASAMKEVRVPIRCINSAAFPTQVETNRKYASGFEVAIIDGVGHFPMLEKPEGFNRMLLDAIAKIAPVQP